MRLLCIKDSTPADRDPRTILVREGSVYHLTNIMRKALFGYPIKVWYQLLETGGTVHCPSLFQPLNDDTDDTDDIGELKTVKTEENE